jgi:acetyl-CoA acetyltransferase
MMQSAALAGFGAQIAPRFDDTREAAIHAAVTTAIRSAGLRSVSEIDMVITVASDMLDGIMVPTSSDFAASCGRAYMNVPSSAGHALAAATVMIESGQARSVLVAGWGQGSKLAEHDNRASHADPFYARPVGGEPAAMAVLQAQRLLATGRRSIADLEQYSAQMRRRSRPSVAAQSVSGNNAWLTPVWCDGAAAMVLSNSAGEGAVTISDFASVSRSYWPETDDLDPGRWVAEALRQLRDPSKHDGLSVVEAGATAPFCEVYALEPVLAAQQWTLNHDRVNPSGGGASACFGPATGLARVIAVAQALGGRNPGGGPVSGMVLDLAGPLGQAVTAIRLQQRGAVA